MSNGVNQDHEYKNVMENGNKGGKHEPSSPFENNCYQHKNKK